MTEGLIDTQRSRAATFFNNLSPSSKAALVFALPYIIVDAIHYYTAGTALFISFPIVLAIFLLSGVLAGKFAHDDRKDRSEFIRVGAVAGLKLWFLSTLVNTLISLIVGAASLGMTIFLGIPYLCLCAPFFLITSGVLGGLGSFLFTIFAPRTPNSIIESGDQFD